MDCSSSAVGPATLKRCGQDSSDWADQFVTFMKTPSPALNNDIYRDAFIRRFFERLSEGQPLPSCPIPQNECWSVGSIGGVILTCGKIHEVCTFRHSNQELLIPHEPRMGQQVVLHIDRQNIQQGVQVSLRLWLL